MADVYAADVDAVLEETRQSLAGFQAIQRKELLLSFEEYSGRVEQLLSLQAMKFDQINRECMDALAGLSYPLSAPPSTLSSDGRTPAESVAFEFFVREGQSAELRNSAAPSVEMDRGPSSTSISTPGAARLARAGNVNLTRAAYVAALESVDNSAWKPLRYFKKVCDEHGCRVPSKPTGFLCECVQSKTFVTMSTLMILANAMYIGYCADGSARAAIDNYSARKNGLSQDSATPDVCSSEADFYFTVAFSVELLLRLVALRLSFWFGRGAGWNMLDGFVVVGAATESFLGVSGADTTFLRLLRVVRLFRTVQVVRRQPQFGKLRLMLLAIFESVVPLCWTILLLTGIMIMFAVLILQLTVDYVESAQPEDASVEVLVTYFHSLPMSVLTLCMSITGGVNWWELQEAFLEISSLVSGIFIFYVAFMILALLNIVTGIFVNDSINASQSDREFKTMALVQRYADSINDLRDMFKAIDTDGSGAITLHEFLEGLTKNEIKLTLECLGVDAPNAVMLFETLDVDGDMQLEIDEFIMGCSALSVSAKSIDMEMMKAQNKKMMKMLKSLCTLMQTADDPSEAETLSVPPLSTKAIL